LKEIKIGEHAFQLDAYNHEAEIYINDESYDVAPGSDQMKVKIGTMNDLTVYFSLVDWDVKDKDGKKVVISPKFDFEGRVITQNLQNYRRYLPPGTVDKLFVEAAKLVRLSAAEKKTSEEPSVIG
jgi:hypothetical protein